MKKSKSAFTFIEILITISIIGILVSLIMPGLIKARNQAVKTTCLNNIKQIMLAMNIYAEDNNGVYPLEIIITQQPSGPGVASVIYDIAKKYAFKKLLTENYVDNENIFYCPATNRPTSIYSTYLYNETTDQRKGANRNAASNYPLVCDLSNNHGQLSGYVGYTGGQATWITVGGSWPLGIPRPATDGNNPEPDWDIQELP